MVIPNYSKQDDWERFNALGVSQYGQMTADRICISGRKKGIVHGTTITVLNAGRKISNMVKVWRGSCSLPQVLGGMSGAQPKARQYCRLCVSITAGNQSKATYPLFTGDG